MKKVVIALAAVGIIGCGGGSSTKDTPTTTPAPVVTPTPTPVPIVKMGIFRAPRKPTGQSYSNSVQADNISVDASLSVGRYCADTIVLNNGKVLIAGGTGINGDKPGDVFDPVTETVSQTNSIFPARMSFFRIGMKLYFSSDTGIYLYDEDTDTISHEVETPSNTSFVAVGGGMTIMLTRIGANTNLEYWIYGVDGYKAYVNYVEKLSSAKFVFCGGSFYAIDPLNDKNIYRVDLDGTITAISQLPYAIVSPSAITVSDHQFVIYGGSNWNTNEMEDSVYLFDTTINKFTKLQSLVSGLGGGTVSTLQNGWQLISGGGVGTTIPNSTEFVHNWSENLSGITGRMISPRSGHTQTIMNNGLALIAGGNGTEGVVMTSIEVYDPQQSLTVLYRTTTLQVGTSEVLSVTGTSDVITWTITDSDGKNVGGWLADGILTPMYKTTVTIVAKTATAKATIVINVVE